MISAREFSELVDSDIGVDELTSVPEVSVENKTAETKCLLPNIYKAPMMETG